MTAPEDLTPEGWHTADSARAVWADALHIDDDELDDLLATAQVQCVAYAPAVEGVVPVNYRQGQIMQARNIWQSIKKDTSGSIGPDGLSIPVFPMDWVVKAILRPKRGLPSFGI